MNRRGFLTRSGLALGALIVGDEALELVERLSHKKVWAGHTFNQPYTATLVDIARQYGGMYNDRILELIMREQGFYHAVPWKVS